MGTYRLPGPAAHPPGRAGAPLQDPADLQQEIWALPALYQALCRTMVTATGTIPGTDPDRASFTIALETAKDTLTRAAGVITSDASLTGRIDQAVLASLLPSRRPRVSARKAKSPLSRYNKADPHRPRRSTPVTSLTFTISNPRPLTPPTTRHDQHLTASPGP